MHNALSLCQVDSFLNHVTTANFKTPGSSPRLVTSKCKQVQYSYDRLLPSPEKICELPGEAS